MSHHERYRRLVADRAVGPDGIVVLTPFLHFQAGVVKRQEPVGVEAFAAELAVEDSMKALSVGLPGREKPSSTPRW